ncbi:MAG TPA: exo-beta-N-acetylmuramidase NamZ domain-containing protein [Candidatus Acidoferrales bacterium]|nr:exo-beta-N-acetylmuramidase NamZ domain-containing protein [Candidatus Acidoferrales bacterium]
MLHNRAAKYLFRARFITGAFVLSLTLAPIFAQAPKQAMRKASAQPSLSVLDSILEDAVQRDEIPGAVLLVSHRGRVVYRKAIGYRALAPLREPMTVDTVFDLASLTKLFATTPSVMRLVEQGKIHLNDPLARYIPEFASNGKDQITIRMLLTHTAGLAPDPPLEAALGGEDALLKEINGETLMAPPGDRFIYSDTNFILLGELVKRLTGKRLDEFAAENFYRPLGMTHTRFLPPVSWIPKIAPTEEIDLPPGAKPGSGLGHVLHGVVHDPRSRAIGGVAGHAGLFSNADDLALFCRMLLADGRIPGTSRRLFAAATVHKMTTPQTPPWSPNIRGLGWDIDTGYSAPRGDLFPLGSYGHTGFTGTSVWIDPSSQTFIILLANSVHPYERPPISPLRAKIANTVAAELNIGDTSGFTSKMERSIYAERPYGLDGIYHRSDETLAGIDVLELENFASLQGKRVGLITNQTGKDRAGRRTIDVLAHAPGVKLVAIFSPEHGILGKEDSNVASSTDAATGLPIYSLYGNTKRPTDAMLLGLDALVYDIQDAGVRFYTFITTMAYSMEAAASHHLAFYVLDRPDPLNGITIEGPMLDRDKLNFVGYFSMPVRYAMTLGELATMFSAENKIGADLHVITLKNWHRADSFEATGLAWIPPSPNLRSLNAALLYPGIEILQAGGISVGRGTDTPFELFGAPWIHGVELAQELNRQYVPGVRFVPTQFTPDSGPYKGELCEGISLVISDRASLNSMLMGLEIAAALQKLYPDHFALDKIIELVGNADTMAKLKSGESPLRIVWDWQPDLDAFRALRAKYLLYPE